MHAHFYRWTAAVFVIAALSVPDRAHAQGAETIIEWNQAALTTLGTPGAASPTVFFTRPMSILHVAVFDALNSFDRIYTPYVDFVDVAPGASRDAAAAQAAHDVLANMFPTQQQVFSTLLATQMSRIPPAAAESGARVGAVAARAVLERRATDGWNRPQPIYLLPSMPGYWQPTPPQSAPATFGHYPDVTPFAIGSARQFLVEPPPALTSARVTCRLQRRESDRVRDQHDTDCRPDARGPVVWARRYHDQHSCGLEQSDPRPHPHAWNERP